MEKLHVSTKVYKQCKPVLSIMYGTREVKVIASNAYCTKILRLFHMFKTKKKAAELLLMEKKFSKKLKNFSNNL